MCYSEKEGTFPFLKEELTILQCILSERICEMKEDFEAKDPHKFIMLCQLNAKIEGYLWMMGNRETEVNSL